MSEFSDNIAKFAKKTKLNADMVIRKVSLDIFRAVVKRSPVDTGRFRANWNLGVGAVNYEVRDITDKDGDRTILGIRQRLAGDEVKAGSVVYITNSLPYGIPLEYGHSQQFGGQGMVRVTLREYETFIANAVRSLK